VKVTGTELTIEPVALSDGMLGIIGAYGMHAALDVRDVRDVHRKTASDSASTERRPATADTQATTGSIPVPQRL
jgi:hypothetical protein